MHIHFTSSYHPEADGQTERVNQTLEQYLCTYCNYQQDNQALLLSLAEFAYNNTSHASTRVSPFFANKGYNPSITVYPDRDITSEQACDLVTDLDTLHQELRQNIATAQHYYQGPGDACRTLPPPLEVGQEVFVKTKYFCTTCSSHKLSNWYEGPFKIIAQSGPQSYTLKLPNIFCAVHPVFHISMLEPSMPNTIPNRTQLPPPLVEINRKEEFEISEILDSKIDRR